MKNSIQRIEREIERKKDKWRKKMTVFLLQWAVFLFLVGLILSLPLGAIYYLHMPQVKQFFTNPRKLRSAHLDFFMQAFSIGLVSLLEVGMNINIPIYVVTPLAFGTFFNPFIFFLLEATSLFKTNIINIFYNLLKGVSPTSLFFAWFMILILYLPIYFLWLIIGLVIIFLIAFAFYKKDASANRSIYD